MTLSAALIAGLWTAISVHLRAYESGRHEVEQAQLFRALSRRLAADVASAVNAGANGTVPGLPTPVAATAATTDSAAAPSSASPTASANSPKSGLNLGLSLRNQPLRLGSVPPSAGPTGGNSPPRSSSPPTAANSKPSPQGTPAAGGKPASGASVTNTATAPPPPVVHKTISVPGGLQLAGGSHWLEMTVTPSSVPHRDDAFEDDASRARRVRPRTVRYYLGIPGEAWMEVMSADDGAPVRGVLVRREQLPPVPAELIPGNVPLAAAASAPADRISDPTPTQPATSAAPALPAPSEASTEGMLPETLGLTEIPEVSSLSLRYFDGQAWLDHWHSGEMGRMPLAIEVLWAVAKPMKSARGHSPTPEEWLARDQQLAAVDPFAEYLLTGPNVAPDLAAEESPWQVARVVLPIAQGHAATPAANESLPAEPTAAPGSPAPSSSQPMSPMPMAVPGEMR